MSREMKKTEKVAGEEAKSVVLSGLEKTVKALSAEQPLKQGIFVYVPSGSILPGSFGGIRSDDAWGRSTPISWMQAGPAWVKSGGDIWTPDELIMDFGGKLTPRLSIDLAQLNVRILMGSVEESRWRIAVPKKSAKEVSELLRASSDVNFIKEVSVGAK